MRVINGLMFFPRGGSAQVTRSLTAELEQHGWEVRIVSGSVPGTGDARRFYDGHDVVAVDFDAGDAPMHPSYEDRAGVRDVCFARVDDDAYAEHVAAWAAMLEAADAASADVLLLHHLTPLNEAAARVAPGVPVVGHLHGTELLILEQIVDGPPASWVHADAWARRMRRWAAACQRLIVPTAAARDRALRLLGVDPSVLVVIPNGYDPALFRDEPVDRGALWRHVLVEDPQGWRPGQDPGSVAYTEEQVARLADAVVLLAVGRYTAVKRLNLLIEAFAAAQQRTRRAAALVVLGGHPGEWEGEHPYDTVQRTGARDIFLAGWHDHDELGDFFNATDVQVLASVNEQFGLVLVEGMACGLPAIAVDRAGPARIVSDGRTGWLVEPDDVAALTTAIVEAVDDEDERARRGLAARREAEKRWAWPALAARIGEVLESATAASAAEPELR